MEGTLQFRDVTVDPTTGSVILRIVFPNPDGVLLPGMFVRAVVKEGVNEQAILIPQQAVSRDPKGNPSALVVDAEGKVEQRPLDARPGHRRPVARHVGPRGRRPRDRRGHAEGAPGRRSRPFRSTGRRRSGADASTGPSSN